MPQVFHRSANTVARVSIVGALLLVAGLLTFLYAYVRSDYYTRAHAPITQPVPFSHQHHVAGLGIDCRYCHTSVEYSSFAGLPPTQTCMNCHSQIWTQAPVLQPVRDSWQTGQPIIWNRVNNLPDFVYFNHSIHVQKGIGCETCHGRIDQMPLTAQAASLHMELVPRLPPRSGQVHPAARPGLHHGLAAAARPGGARPAIGAAVPRPKPDKLLDVPSLDRKYEAS